MITKRVEMNHALGTRREVKCTTFLEHSRYAINYSKDPKYTMEAFA